MATVTGTTLLNGFLAKQNVTTLSDVMKDVLAARLQQMIDAGTTSNIQIATVLAANPVILASVPAGQTPLTVLSTKVGETKTDIEGGTVVTPLTFTLSAAKDSVNEGEANTFTVTASKAVEADTTVTLQLKAGDNAAANQGSANTNLNDFGAGSFNLITKTIAKGQTSVTFDVTGLADSITELSEAYSVEVKVGNTTLPVKTITLLDGSAGAGQTFMLTKGLDNIQGTSGNDTIIGSIDNSGTPNVELNTLSTLDIVNGGAGVDTLSINVTGGATVNLPNMTNVEIVNVESTAGATVDTSAVAGVTNLNVTKAAGAVAATAAATTDVGVSVKGIAGTTVRVDGGKDVTINTTDAAATIDAGAAGTDVTGTVTITATGAKAANTAPAVALGAISVGGGTVINVTQKATSDASGLVAGAAATTHTQGNVIVTAGATTTAVTLKQDAAVTAASTAAVTGVTEVASVKFTKLDAGESVTISGLTFTAAAGKNLTADQVAAAFANLSASAIKPTDVTPTTATGDTNGGSASANGTFTGALLADWTSGAATGDTVVFTGKANTAMATDLVASAKATVTTTTQGVTAVTAANTLGVVNGTVTIAGAAALKTVTVDGYAASTNTAGITGGTNTALDTVSLANGASFEIDSAAATLGLTLANVNGTVDVKAGTKTLNAAVSHAKATETSTLVSASAEAINVSGTGNVAGTTATGGLTAATSINTTGMTAGNATFTIADGTATSYTGGAGVDSVTVTNAGTAITKAIDLGAGDDTLTLNGTVVAPTATLKGGDGTDTIAMNGASAESLSANGTFAGKIEGFEKLHINDTVAAATTVNMANMDGITYVVSNNSSGAAVGEQQTFTLTKGTDAAVGEQQTMVITNGSNAAVAEQQTFTVTAATGAGTAVVMGVNVTIAGTEDQDGVGNAIVAQKAAIIAANPTVADVTYAAGTVTITYTAAAGNAGAATVDADNANTGITFGAVADNARAYDSNAGNITFNAGADVTIALTAGMTVDQVGAAIVAKEADIKTANANVDAVAYDAATDTLTVTYKASAGDVAVFSITDTNIVGFTANAVTNNARAYDSNAGNITVAGGIVAVTAGLTADQLGATIAANEAAIKAANSNVDTVTYDAATDKVTITYTTAAGAQAEATVVDTASVGINVGSFTESRAYAAAGAAPALTLDKMANNGTLELVAAGAGVVVKMADATGSSDSFNIVTKVVSADLNFGELDVAGVETLKLNAIDTTVPPTAGAAVNTATLDIKADKATSLTIEGNSNVTLTLDATTTKLATIDAGTLTGALNAGNTLNAVAMTITGGKGNDVLKASVGATAKADVLNGGDGNDTLYAGSNGAKLTGGDGNDLFIVTANSTTVGSKESNTYSEILDFKAGDLLQLQASNVGGTAAIDVTAFTKLAAVLNENTAQFSDFVNAAIKEAGAGAAVYFNFKGDAYIAIDSAASTDAFVNGEDMVVKLTGINGDNLSWNSDYATVALI